MSEHQVLRFGVHMRALPCFADEREADFDAPVVPVDCAVATQVNVVRESASGKKLASIGKVVAPIDGPIVTNPHHLPAAGAVPDVRREESAPSRELLERLVEVRKIKNRK